MRPGLVGATGRSPAARRGPVRGRARSASTCLVRALSVRGHSAGWRSSSVCSALTRPSAPPGVGDRTESRMEILLLSGTSAAEPAKVLPALDLLGHAVVGAALDASAVVSGSAPEVVLVDAR